MYISLKHIVMTHVYSLYMFMHIYVTCIYVCIYTCFMYLKKYTYESFLNYLPVEVPPTSFIFPLYHIPFVFRNILILSSKYTWTRHIFYSCHLLWIVNILAVRNTSFCRNMKYFLAIHHRDASQWCNLNAQGSLLKYQCRDGKCTGSVLDNRWGVIR